jgi:hypothetical protein
MPSSPKKREYGPEDFESSELGADNLSRLVSIEELGRGGHAF